MSDSAFDWIGFDADDTLWLNETLYRQVRSRFQQMMAGYGQSEGVNEVVNRIEIDNLSYYGYGPIGFVVSLIEAGVELTDGEMSTADIKQLLDLSKEMIDADVQLLPGAERVVAELSQTHTLLLVTKGDLQHQLAKVERSGLRNYFEEVEVVSEKGPAVYRALLDRYAIRPERFLMVGNSMRSDILPVLEVGGWAAHVNQTLTWEYEEAEGPDENDARFLTVGTLGELPAALRKLAAAE
jgi:putative hydrolase of the HAD superfamily